MPRWLAISVCNLSILRLVLSGKLGDEPAQIPQLIQRLINVNPIIKELFDEVVAFNTRLAKDKLSERTRRSTQIVSSMRSIFITSGISDSALLQWIMDIDTENMNQSDQLELEKYGLMVNEGIYILGELLKKFAGILQQLKVPEPTMKVFMEQFTRLNRLF